jgi:hypothetical protein
MIGTGDRVWFRQVEHIIDVLGSGIQVHPDPEEGRGDVVMAFPVNCSEMRLFVVPDEQKGRKNVETRLLRVPPDEVEVIDV